MSDLNSLNIETVRAFMLSRGGKVTNHELVKHFKGVLTNPETRDEARVKFKEIVNTLATIARDADGGKQLTIRKKYREQQGTPSRPTLELPTELNLQYTPVYQSPTTDYPDLSRRASQDSLFSPIAFKPSLATPRSPPPHGSLPGTPLSGVYHSYSPTGSAALSRRESVASLAGPPLPDPPQQPVQLQREPSPPQQLQQRSSQVQSEQQQEQQHDPPPPVPPRRRSSDKIRLDMEETENKENKVEDEERLHLATKDNGEERAKSNDKKEYPDTDINMPTEDKLKGENIAVEDGKVGVSVKERRMEFDRIASEVNVRRTFHPNKKRQEKTDRDEEDGVTMFDSKSRTWIVRCAQGDYQAIAKLAADNPKLVKFKDPTSGYTALHWAAKHGNGDLVKLIAGTHQADVNARTNGGYTPLHIAMQFGHEDVYSLLTEVYGADQNLRDWSGKKPHQYHTNKGTTVSADTFRKIKARKKHAEKDLGFLRIGSLNVRVKKTTEAVSNFLGVGNAEKIHKHWGSADNLPQGGDNKKMPPPKYAPIKKRKSKRGSDFSSRSSVVVTTDGKSETQQDSDSDAGFGSTWQSTV